LNISHCYKCCDYHFLLLHFHQTCLLQHSSFQTISVLS
jgi:hypothetical protein